MRQIPHSLTDTKPGMFFVKPEETTAAASSDTESSGTE